MTAVGAFFFGGTISVRGPSPDPEGGSARLTGDELVRDIDLPGVRVVAEQVRAVGSSKMTFDDVLTVVHRARQAIHDGSIDAAVIVQGTDTLEEVAFLVDLLWDLDAPIVLTGAMRRPGHAGADGPANLRAAFATAAANEARGMGALVVLADEVHAARLVSKRHASLPHAFGSSGAGPVGHLVEGRPRFATRPIRPAPMRIPVSMCRTVAVHLCTLDEDPGMVRALASAADALVVAAFGVGHVSVTTADALEDIARTIPVVLSSQNGAGTIHHDTYRGPGSEHDLLRRGLISAGSLRPGQARVLLAVLLGLDTPEDQLARAFADHA